MGLRDQVKTLLWQHGVENDALLDALDWKLKAHNMALREEIKQLNTENDRLISDLARAALAKEAGK